MATELEGVAVAGATASDVFRKSPRSRRSGKLRRRPAAAEASAGFTIVELLVAMGILLFGTVSLLGVLGVGVSTHRSAEQHNQAVQLAQRVLQRLEEEVVPKAVVAAAAAGPDAEFKLAAVDSTPADVAFVPGLRYRVEFVQDPEHPSVALATVRVLWLEQGEAQAVEFQRIFVSHVPFSQRIARLRDARR